MNDNILDALKKVSGFEDQVLVGEDRVQRNVDTVIKILQASREADLGPSANAIADALIEIAEKSKLIIGRTNEVNPVA